MSMPAFWIFISFLSVLGTCEPNHKLTIFASHETTMDDAGRGDEQICHDLWDVFEGAKPPLKLKKIRQRIQAKRQTPAVEKLVSMYGLDKLGSITLRLLNEGSFESKVRMSCGCPIIAGTDDIPDRPKTES